MVPTSPGMGACTASAFTNSRSRDAAIAKQPGTQSPTCSAGPDLAGPSAAPRSDAPPSRGPLRRMGPRPTREPAGGFHRTTPIKRPPGKETHRRSHNPKASAGRAKQGLCERIVRRIRLSEPPASPPIPGSGGRRCFRSCSAFPLPPAPGGSDSPNAPYPPTTPAPCAPGRYRRIPA